MTPTIMLALSTSVLFGVGDFLGGVATRRDSAFAVAGTSHLISMSLMVIVIAVLPAADPSVADLGFGALSGLAGVLGVLALYAALAVGRMGIVAPISAALSAALPAIFDLACGTKLSPVTISGIVLAIVAIIIVSIAPDDQLHEPLHEYRPRRALGLAILSGIGFSTSFIALSFTAPESGLTPIISARIVSIAVAVVLALRFGGGFPVRRAALKPTMGAGLADVLANITMLTAIRIGPLAVASVLGSLFPVVVVALARIFLKERLHPWQRVGVVIAVVAVLFSAVP
ncbi:MAG: EamA family transporter [Coriobacteriia bacterium]|nr:EamA family transporter [Coriobacteriia bacterium]